MFFKKKKEKKNFDRQNFRPVLRCSICNGEQVAGFKNISTGEFREIAFIRSPSELETFLDTYDIRAEEISKEY